MLSGYGLRASCPVMALSCAALATAPARGWLLEDSVRFHVVLHDDLELVGNRLEFLASVYIVVPIVAVLGPPPVLRIPAM